MKTELNGVHSKNSDFTFHVNYSKLQHRCNQSLFQHPLSIKFVSSSLKRFENCYYIEIIEIKSREQIVFREFVRTITGSTSRFAIDISNYKYVIQPLSTEEIHSI